MVAFAYTVAFEGVEARLVEVQCAVTAGVPGFAIVGLPDKAVSEARERVRTALTGMAIALPSRRITVNLSPADLPKEGSHFDLPIALALLAALEIVPKDVVEDTVALVDQDSGEIIVKQYDDGGVYEGTFKNGLQHGRGTYRLPNGYEYTGEWIEGEIRGQGIARYPNGSVYEGEFALGKPEGRGKITFADGGTYEGECVGGQITGTAAPTRASGTTGASRARAGRSMPMA